MADNQATVVNQLDEQEARWFAVYTRFRREKQVLKYLSERGIQAYLPIQSFTRRYTRKIKHVQLPLINCYIFTKITKQEYVPVLETPDVVNFVRFAKDLIAIPDAEMNVMKRVVGEGIEIDAQPGSYQLGDEVEIVGGNLTGLKGWLVETASEKNFVIELENLGYTLRMSLDPTLLLKTGRRASDRSKNNRQGSAGFGWSLL